MVNKIDGLKKYWHVIAFSKELVKNRSICNEIYGKSLLIWRDNQNEVHAILNCCAHKKAPLAVTNYKLNELTCPYHGWKYEENGNLIEIPSSPHLDLAKLNCTIQKFPVIEQDGFVWITLSAEFPEFTPPTLSETNFEFWGKCFLQSSFKTTEELIIENFMDATHTSTIHKGIIRGHQKEKVKHTINVETHKDGVSAEFEETSEQIAFGLQFLLGKNLRIKHTDEFLLPNIVRVNYFINDVHRFNAFIACIPVSTGKTQAFIRLSFNFKFFNPFIKLILPILARKVLQQDFKITAEQYNNQLVFSEMKEKHIDADKIHNKVRGVRQAANEEKAIVHSSNTIEIHL